MRREPIDYSVTEEIAHSSIHALGSHLGAAMLALLVVFGVQSGTQVFWKVVSGSVFGVTIILLYTVSSVYHAVTHPRAKQILEVCDHMAIYFLIAGSYTPFTLVTLREAHPRVAWTIFGIVWGLTAAGVIFKIFTTGKLRVASTLAYIGMGWIVVFAVKPLMDAMPLAGLAWLAAGGGRRTLHGGHGLLSVADHAVPPRGVAPFRAGRHVQPLRLRALLRDDAVRCLAV